MNGPTSTLPDKPSKGSDALHPRCPGAALARPDAKRRSFRPLAGLRGLLVRLTARRVLLGLVLAGAYAALFVGWDVAAGRLLPNLPTAWRHGLLTGWAAVVTAAACGTVYYVLHRQYRRLSATAEELAHVIDAFQADRRASARFENPHLVHCREVLACARPECPMYDAPGKRCWQVMALKRIGDGHATPEVEIEQCRRCEVYRRSCPDKLSELGESFNNLAFLLEQEARQVGQMRAQMLEKEKMVAVGQIAAGVAHEIGNPLSSISSIVQMLKRKGSAGSTSPDLDLIETHIRRITSTVRQLVSLARPGDDRWELVDVGKTLEEAVRLIAFDRRARNVTIDFAPPPTLPRTYGLQGQLQQVFINLALNALDAMPGGGKLSIQAEKQQGRIVVRFEDTGCGIAPEIGRRVFEPFFTTKQPGQGTGLGLAVSYGIIQKHGGEIELRSIEGQGTVFTVDIPAMDQPPRMNMAELRPVPADNAAGERHG